MVELKELAGLLAIFVLRGRSFREGLFDLFTLFFRQCSVNLPDHITRKTPRNPLSPRVFGTAETRVFGTT